MPFELVTLDLNFRKSVAAAPSSLWGFRTFPSQIHMLLFPLISGVWGYDQGRGMYDSCGNWPGETV